MGYVPPPPSGMIVLLKDVTYANLATVKDAWGRYVAQPRSVVRLSMAYDYDTGEPDTRGWTERNVNALGYGLLGAFAALIVTIAWIVAR